MTATNRNQAQQLRAKNTRVANAYVSAGRPLTLTDLNFGQGRPAHEASNRSRGLSATDDSAPYNGGHGRRYSGRLFNPPIESTRYSSPRARGMDATGNSYLATSADSPRSSSLRPNEYSGRPFNPLVDLCPRRQPAVDESRLHLECEMAKSKDYALERLKAERTHNCDPYFNAQMTTGGRMRRSDVSPQRQQAQQFVPCECQRIPRTRAKVTHPGDINRVYDYNIPVGSPVGSAAGRPVSSPVASRVGSPVASRVSSPVGRDSQPLDIPTNLPYRGLNVPTPKPERATSCPTPLQRMTPHSSVQRGPRVGPRPTQPGSVQRPPTSPVNVPRYPAPSSHTQPGPPIITTAGGSRRPISTFATSTPIMVIPPSQRPAPPSHQQPSYAAPITSPERSADSSHTPQGDRIQSQDSSNISTHMDAGYGQTPPRDQTSQSVQTPAMSFHVTDQFTNTSLRQADASVGGSIMPSGDNAHTQTSRQISGASATDQSPLARTPPDPIPPTPSPMQDPNNDTHRDMQRHYPSTGQSRSPGVLQAEATLTNPTQESHYYNPSMIDEPSHHRTQPNECPPNDYIDLTEETQYDRNDMDISEPDLTLDSTHPQQEASRTIHSWTIPSQDLTCIDVSQQPSAAHCPPQMQVVCEQPRASLFRCLAQKLSSTYNFLSSFVAPSEALVQPMQQPPVQVCHEPEFGQVLPYNAARQRDLRNTLVEEPASLRECANAKKCGRVQFDSSDKKEAHDPHRRAIERAEMENLVNDAYCPGIIQDTLDGRDNFNDHAFSLYSPRDDIHDPMTLLEAFSKRIEKERAEINKDVRRSSTQEKVAEIVHQYFADLNPSDLNRSIKSLIISERLQDREQIERSNGISWEAEVQKGTSTWPNNPKLKVITYTGRTHPKAIE